MSRLQEIVKAREDWSAVVQGSQRVGHDLAIEQQKTAYVEYKKSSKLVNITKKKQTHRYRQQTSGYQQGEGRGRGNVRLDD